MFGALYDFCRDQGSIIGGLLALAAGYLVFSSVRRSADQQMAAVNAQAEAARQQNRDLRDDARHRQTRDAIVALKLLGGVLALIRDDIDRLKQLLEQPRYGGANRLAPTNYRQLLYRPPLSILWDDLGMCSPQTISNYLRLDARLAEFVRSQVLRSTSCKMKYGRFRIFWSCWSTSWRATPPDTTRLRKPPSKTDGQRHDQPARWQEELTAVRCIGHKTARGEGAYLPAAMRNAGRRLSFFAHRPARSRRA